MTEEASGGTQPPDGSETVEAQLPDGFEIPDDSEVKVEAVNPQGRSLWIPLPWIPVPTQPPPPPTTRPPVTTTRPPVTTTRPPVTTTTPPVTTTPPPVTTTPPPLTATIAERSPQQGGPGSQVIASVLVTNTGATSIGVQTVVLTAPAGTRLLNGYLGTWREPDVEDNYPGTLSPDGTTSTCSGVPVNLDPGQWAVFYTAVIVDAGATPGPAPVTFAIGTPAFATGTGSITVL
ncbi:hypothetical protein QZH56_29350 [Streptomyces olivoreticuli]|uniref:hypothetical protein n=1 Tax=Streptomyces olivoreticuli TaxID=68246 RepID=UPI0026598420|nr:hypothetical protein [Streptomyces olivoreticuli]WKK22825.1 hypothetical protein QZH56_29350 [Streptomyces olivoreticuli]